jgi:ABC-2 type transport system permease protein
MIAQLKKELQLYFSGILGYLIIGIYLLVNGLMLWIFNGVLIPHSSGKHAGL